MMEFWWSIITVPGSPPPCPRLFQSTDSKHRSDDHQPQLLLGPRLCAACSAVVCLHQSWTAQWHCQRCKSLLQSEEDTYWIQRIHRPIQVGNLPLESATYHPDSSCLENLGESGPQPSYLQVWFWRCSRLALWFALWWWPFPLIQVCSDWKRFQSLASTPEVCRATMHGQ